MVPGLSPQALARFKVLDLTRARAGPTCARQLADWGADVIKIEEPPKIGADDLSGARHGFDFQNLHRNKRSMTLNLKHPDGVAIFKRLATDTDVIVENYRSRVKHRLGIDYEAIRAINPRIVYGSISGFGQDGPYVDRPGVDQIAQGMGGLMSITGLPGQGPVRVGIPIADLTTGMYCAIGILSALLEREVSGEGQWVHTSLLESQIAMLDFQASRWTIAGEVAPQAGNNHPTGIPTGVFETSDGHINIAASGANMYQRFCTALGAPELFTDDRFSSSGARYKNRDELNGIIDSYTAKNTSDYWVTLMNEAGVPCGPINSIDQTFADPQVQHLEMTKPVEHATLGAVNIIDQPVNMSRTPAQMRLATPECGEHTDEVLGSVGYSAAEIAGFREVGAI
jgi:crotonobetainyl-CoA:carnitine CoA-transferase CaiB-like acyl-CoA transferase